MMIVTDGGGCDDEITSAGGCACDDSDRLWWF